jgi:hypothetical protein
MRTKVELYNDVNQIPTFEFKQIALALPAAMGPRDQPDAWDVISTDEHRAITEVGSSKPLAFVSDRYQLVQFRDGFIPLVNDQADCEGNLYYHEGFAVLDVFPTGTDYALAGGSQLGISAYNSVNKTSALIIRFSVTDGKRTYTLPKNISSYYKAHVGAAAASQQQYIQMINKIKDVWVQAVADMSAKSIDIENFGDYAIQLSTDPRILKAVKLEISSGIQYNLWSMAMRIYDEMQTRYSKSEIHRRKRLDAFVESLISWGTIYKLAGD